MSDGIANGKTRNIRSDTACFGGGNACLVLGMASQSGATGPVLTMVGCNPDGRTTHFSQSVLTVTTLDTRGM